MTAFNSFINDKIVELSDAHLLREIKTTIRNPNGRTVRNGKHTVSFSCNDYLGLSQHPEVMKAAHAALEDYGVGAGASRLVTGNNPLYDGLESQLASYKQTEASCIFGSGYLANIGAIPALVGKEDLVIADKLVHACIVDGIRLSGAKLQRFKHNDVAHAKKLLHTYRASYKRCIIVTETVFSMDGDRAPLEALYALACEHDAWLMTDDAHGLGIIKSKAHIQMGTLSKAAGVYGGYICASEDIITWIKNTARSLVYSTALPPAMIAASIKAVEQITAHPELGQKALENARLFTKILGLKEAESTIVPMIIGDSECALEASRALEEEGFLVVAIRPPTVPRGTARLRVSFSAEHQEDDIRRLARSMTQKGLVHG